jgi:hypothetical protein
MDLDLRHTLATLAYRSGKVLRGAPATFGDFQIHDSVRTPVRILAHMGDLMDWALTQVEGNPRWNDSVPLPWEEEVARFFAALAALDARIAAGGGGAAHPGRLFQGPIADALTHTGQLAMLRHVAGMPVRAENYAAAIAVGKVGPEQAAPRNEFD